MKEKFKILIVDDNPSFIKAFQLLINEVLKDKKHSIDCAYNATDGIELITDIWYDYIFMDIRMPGMDGITAIRLIDQNYSRRRSKIIAISFHKEMDYIKEVLGAGARKYLVKDEIDEQKLQAIFEMKSINNLPEL